MSIRYFKEYNINIMEDIKMKVIISHAHWDHIKQANQFDEVYINHNDFYIFELFKMDINYSKFLNIKDGEILDLGDRMLMVRLP